MKFQPPKNRRKRKNTRNISKTLRFMGVNSAGLRSKLPTFKKIIRELDPSMFFVQETKFKEEGKIKISDYVIFEKVRNAKNNGGGLAIGCKPDLNPVWVREGEEDLETLSVNIFVKNLKIRCCTGYGYQEGEIKEKKDAFWQYLDTEVLEAKNDGAGLIIQMDGNLWAGKTLIKNDPRPQNSNGRMFQQFLDRNLHLTVVNSLNICEGLITRKRARNGKMEMSVLDFFIVCDRVLPFVTRMFIDEDKKYVLTNYENVRKGGKANDTDHATEYMDLELKVITKKPVRNEIWNFKCRESQEAFRKQTSDTDLFTNCFENELPLMKQIENWKIVLNRSIKEAFKKVRIKNNPKPIVDPRMSGLIDKLNKLVDEGRNKKEIDEIEQLLVTLKQISTEIKSWRISKI